MLKNLFGQGTKGGYLRDTGVSHPLYRPLVGGGGEDRRSTVLVVDLTRCRSLVRFLLSYKYVSLCDTKRSRVLSFRVTSSYHHVTNIELKPILLVYNPES